MPLDFNTDAPYFLDHERRMSLSDIDKLKVSVDRNYITIHSPHTDGRKYIHAQSAEKLVIEHTDGSLIEISAKDFHRYAALDKGDRSTAHFDLRTLAEELYRIDSSPEPTYVKIRGEAGFMTVISGRNIKAKGDNWDNQFTFDIHLRKLGGIQSKVKIDGRLGTDVASFNFAFADIDTVKLFRLDADKLAPVTPLKRADLFQSEAHVVQLSGKSFNVYARSIEYFDFPDQRLSYREMLTPLLSPRLDDAPASLGGVRHGNHIDDYA